MMAQQERSLTNPLLRRLRRHATMTTIFRSTAETGHVTAVSPSPNPVPAFVWADAAEPDAVEATITRAERPAVQRLPLSPDRPVSDRQPVVSGQQPATVAAPETAVTPPPPAQNATQAQPAVPSIQRQPKTEPAAPPATGSQNKPGPLSRLWQRLGEVIRPSTPLLAATETPPQPAPPTTAAATQPVSVSEAAAASEATSPAVQRQPETPRTAAPHVAVAQEVDATPPAPAPIPSPRVTKPVTAVAPPAVMAEKAEEAPPSPEDRDWRRLETIMQRHTERLAAEQTSEPDNTDDTPGSATQPPAVQRQPGPDVPAGRAAPSKQKPSDSTTAVFTARTGRPQPKEPVDTSPRPVETPPPQPAVVPTPPVAPNEPIAETAVDHTLPASAVPLQAAWPVQRLESERAVDPTRPAPPLEPAAESLSGPPPAADAQVQERLASVPPGRPTDSSVPLLRPRMPRPKRPSAVPTPEPDELDPPAIQRQADAEQLVSTEIGELPFDLWELIGQQPPETAVAPTTTMSQRKPATDRPPTADGPPTAPAGQRQTPPQTQPAAVEAVAVPPPAATYAPPAFIQREPEAGGAEVTAVSDSSPEEEAEADEPEAEMDVDELARQVYGRLKQRLASDRERERGRFAPHW
jgi:hypothetical protein